MYEIAPLPSTPAGHIIDLRGPRLAPESFAQPTAATGEWFIALAERGDARLASGCSTEMPSPISAITWN